MARDTGQGGRLLVRAGDYVHLRLRVEENFGDEISVRVKFSNKRRRHGAPVEISVPAEWDQVVGYEPSPEPCGWCRDPLTPQC